MSQENRIEEPVTLGTYLRKQRELQGITLKETADTTKISLRVLEAIEIDDYDKMPADAFCRGFYAIYAKFLNLNTEEIVARYQEHRGIPAKKKQPPVIPPILKSKSTPNYAEPAAFSPAFTISLLLGIVVFILLCTLLYMGWNPISYVSTQIQNLTQTETTEPFYPEEEQEGDLSLNAAQTPEPAAELTEQQPKNAVAFLPDSVTYTLRATFNTSGILQIVLDNGFTENKQFFAGEILEWQAKEEIHLSVPGETTGTILLNGVEILLPEAEDGIRSLSLPEDLLDQ